LAPGGLENITETAETRIIESTVGDQVPNQIGGIPEIPMNATDAKQMVVEKAEEAIVDHFAGHQEELNEAISKISKFKQRFSSVNSLSEITKRPPNPMKGKPLRVRLLPGLQFQFQKRNDDLLVDINPYLGYKITGNITAGIGWNQRIPYALNHNAFNPDVRVFGPRIFGEYLLGNGFTARLEIEEMNTYVFPSNKFHYADADSRDWVFGMMAGIKKEYRFFRNIRGTSTIMFNLLNHQRNKPYADVVNARLGFEFPPRKKRPRQ
jgi:hypothetical protein